MPLRTPYSSPLGLAPALVPALALAGALAWPGVARADFEITYLFLRSDGTPNPSDRLSSTEMSNYVNGATCLCGEQLGARVFLNQTTGTTYPSSTQVRTFVGFNCGPGQEGLGNDRPCVLLHDGQANDYDDGGKYFTFDQLWLSSRAETKNTPADAATPIQPCAESQVGNGGIWVCVESNDEPGCQSEEFVVQGDTSTNASGATTPTDPTMPDSGSSGNNVRFDYVPPQDDFTGFSVAAGDTRIVITWDKVEVADTVGFRVLCMDSSGNPPFDLVSSVPQGQSRTNGKLYYTTDNLCSGEEVDIPETNDPMRNPPDTPSTGSTGDTGGTGGTDTTGGDIADSALASLDWRYICSDHVSGTGTKAEINGLVNGETYELIVVAYDAAGNPKVVSGVLTAVPVETRDFWEQCEQQGDICGDGGFCRVHTGGGSSGAAWLGTGLLLLGVAARRRRRG